MKTEQSIASILLFATVIAGSLLLVPFTASFYVEGFNWSTSDYLFAFMMFFVTVTSYKMITRSNTSAIYKFAIGFSLFSGFFMVWVNLAVGIIGAEDNPINIYYFIVILIGLVGANLVRLRPEGMARVMGIMAASIIVIVFIALVTGAQHMPHSSVTHILAVNAVMAFLFIQSAFLFHYAAKKAEVTTPAENLS